jgi:integrase
MATITNKTAREKLVPRREPYWLVLGKGQAVGFRRMGRDTWVARFRTPDLKQHYHALGDAADTDYPKAKLAAEAWFAQMAGGARRAPVRGTVRDALEGYIADLRKHGRESAADENEARFKLTIYDERIASQRLDRVTREDFDAWRDGLRQGRQNRSVNRQVRGVAAALNYATKKLGHVGNREAWNLTALSDDVEESGEAAVFLTGTQRDRLIGKAPKALRAYLRGLEHSGARPSELANATVEDFDKVNGSLTLRHRKGRPPVLKARAVGLSPSAVEFFTQQARGKQPTDPLILGPAGHWRRHEWSIGIRAAVEAANSTAKTAAARVPEGASAYSFRHARISELLQVGNMDPLTVAQQTGTSLAMMQKYYFKIVPESLKAKLAAMDAL